MAQKKKLTAPAVDCVCSKCGTEAHSIPNTRHRKCNPDPANRGKWEAK